jgi:hypothetical protein
MMKPSKRHFARYVVGIGFAKAGGMKAKPILATLGAVALGLLSTACASDDASTPEEELPTCDSGKCDGPLDLPDSEIAATPCDGVMVDLSGRKNRKVAGRLNDPIANAVLKAGTSCPTTFTAILAKLREADKAKCPDTSQGLSTRMISETAQLTGQASSMRAVLTRECAERKEHEVFFSLFGLQPSDSALPPNAEFIAFDSTAGVFNYYEADGTGKINFFGNSKDMLKGKGTGQVRRCAGCHTEGGLVMKEFDSPWLHWEGDKDIPGARAYVDKFKADLGTKADGINMESLVKIGNQLWNASRINFLKTPTTTKELLKPLFCTLDVNLGSASISADVSTLPAASLLDKLIATPLITITSADYEAQIAANGQVIEGVPGKSDTAFAYTYIMRSRIAADYVKQLISSGIVDLDLAKDILMLDFTRPIFSSDRCDLLAKLPNIPVADLTPDKIRLALMKGLAGPVPPIGTPARELLLNLADKDDGKHARTLQAFTDACTALGSKKLVANALTVASLNRTIARGMPILEFQETVASDNLSVPSGTRLDPKTCELTTAFVPTRS